MLNWNKVKHSIYLNQTKLSTMEENYLIPYHNWYFSCRVSNKICILRKDNNEPEFMGPEKKEYYGMD